MAESVVVEVYSKIFVVKVKTAREKEQYFCATEAVAEKIVRAHALLVAIHLMQKVSTLKLDLSNGSELVNMLVASKDLAYSIDERDVITDDDEGDFDLAGRPPVARDKNEDEPEVITVGGGRGELTGNELQDAADDDLFGGMHQQ